MSTTAARAALVTGGVRRIGLQIATRLAEAGYALALHASPRSRDEAEAQARTLTAAGARASVVIADLGDAAACSRLIATASDAVGPLGLLVNNASVFEPDEAAAIDVERWERHFAINLRAPVLLSQAFAAAVASGQDAAIVNVIDQRVLRPTPQFFSYTLSKSALWTATRTMAQAFADKGIRVNAVGPGPVLPNSNDGDAGFTKEVEGVPLHRAIKPDEVAAAVLYLADAKGVTGQLIAVDAGQHLAWRTPDVVE